MIEETTTIKLTKRTKARLDNLKEYKHETYEEIISKILDIMNLYKNDQLEAKKWLYLIDQKRKQLLKK